MAAVASGDQWAAWLLEHRFGGDQQMRDQMMPRLIEIRDKVLGAARIQAEDVVLDVGCGDGLLGMAALEQVGESGAVIFSDISADLLDQCRHITSRLGKQERCQFANTGLPDLAGVADESVDVALTRSVLIYVDDKPAAFAALHRVLRPGGRLSIFEPINRFGYPEPANLLMGFDVSGLEVLAGKVKDAYRSYYPAANPMTSFDERDLLACAEDAGFREAHLDYHADIDREPVSIEWPTFLRQSPNPYVPPLDDILTEALAPTDREKLARRLQDQLASGVSHRRLATAYLSATR